MFDLVVNKSHFVVVAVLVDGAESHIAEWWLFPNITCAKRMDLLTPTASR